MNLREHILAQANLELMREAVDVPEWGVVVWVSEMTAHERDEFEAGVQENPTSDLRARMAVATLRDEQGRPLFYAADIPALTRLSGSVMGRLFKIATRINRMRKEDVDDLVKNSDATQPDSMLTGSPNGSA